MSLAVAAEAAAVPTVSGEFPVSGKPGKLAAGADGNVWVLIDGAVNELARVGPGGAVIEYDIDDLNPEGGVTAGPDGRMWFTATNSVVSISPANPTATTVTAINEIGANPQKIITGPDGNLWTAGGDDVIRIPPGNPAGYAAFNFPGLDARGISGGGDGRIWIADFGGDRVVRIGTDGAGLAPFATGAGSNPQDVTSGPGAQMAYTAPNVTRVGRITAAGTVLPTASGLDPFGVVFGTDGAYWIAQFASDNLGRLTPQGGFTSLAGFSAGSGPRQIATGPQNTLWVSLETAERVARVTGVEPPAPPPAPPAPPGVGHDAACPAVSILRAKGIAPKRARAGRSRGRVAAVGVRLRLNRPAVLRVVRAVAIYRVAGKRRAVRLGSRGLRGRTVGGRSKVRLLMRMRGNPRIGRRVVVRLAIRARAGSPECALRPVRTPPMIARVIGVPRRATL